MVEGLQLYKALLTTISPRLDNKDGVSELQTDIRDLTIQINKVGEYVWFPHSLTNDPHF